ncbi:hypothetical protein QM012_002603 [Aureobasidium pullulans]|uniref:Uncharacterized protein n=1 Tax=Aureobasidium pullulans TaxID=5580 RepID=A0ABR0TAG3_AURPU
MPNTFLNLFLIALSIINSVLLTLTIWAALQLRGSDWWIIFLIAFIMGLLYEVDYMRRKRPGYHPEHRGPIELRLRDFYGLTNSDSDSISSDGINRSSIRSNQRQNSFDTPIVRPQTAHTRVRPAPASPASTLQNSQIRALRRPVTPAFI